jgi:UDP-N-acetylmuramate dehydrogenase
MDREGRVCRFKGGDIQYAYRQTVIPVEGVVSRLYLELQRGVKERIFASMRKMNRMRKMKQPWGAKTFGSVFKNPKGGYAGKLIEEAGLSGLRIGDAEVSKKHANFIINRGKAKSRDIDSLIKYMEKKVREENGIALEREVRYVGW